MSFLKPVLAFVFCVQFISAADAKEVCAAAEVSAQAQAAFVGAKDLVQSKNQNWIGDACAAIPSARVSYLPEFGLWSVGYADDGDCSGNVFLNYNFEVTGYGLVGCY